MNSLALVKITDFLNLHHGWCYGEGISFLPSIADKARRIVTSLLSYGFNTIDAFPGLNGEIRIAAYVQTHYLEFTLENDDLITFVYEVDDQELEYKGSLSLDDCVEIIKKLSHLCSNSYESFIKDISIETADGFKASRSGHLQTEGFLLSVTSAQWKPQDRYVSIFKTTMPMSVDTRQFSGYSMLQSCRAPM